MAFDPISFLITVAINIGLAALTAKNTKVGKLDSLDIDLAGGPARLPLIYGRAEVTGQTIWIKNNQLIERKKTDKHGPFGLFGSTTTYTYYATFAVALCEGPAQVRKVWLDDELTYDASTQDIDPNEDLLAGIGWDPSVLSFGARIFAEFLLLARSGGPRIYRGTMTQLPDPEILDEHGEAGTPAYRGTCYIVFNMLKLAKYGNRIPRVTAEVVGGESNTFFHIDISAKAGGFPSETSIDYESAVLIGESGGLTIDRYDMRTGRVLSTIDVKDAPGFPGSFYAEIGASYYRPLSDGQWALDGYFVNGNNSREVVIYDPLTGAVTGATAVAYGTAEGMAARGNKIAVWNNFSNKVKLLNSPPATIGAAFDVEASQGDLGWPTPASIGTLNNSRLMIGGDGAVYACYPDGSSNLHFCKMAADGASGYAVDISAAIGDCRGLFWFDDDDTVIVCGGSSPSFAKIDPSDGSVIATLSTGAPSSGARNMAMYGEPRDDGLYPFPSGGMTVGWIDFGSMTEVETTDLSGVSAGDILRDCGYHRATGSLIINALNLGRAQVFLDRPTGSETLGGIVSDLADRVGLDAADLDVSAATQPIEGLKIIEQTPRQAIADMTTVYPHDVVEEDFTLKVFPRGGKTPIVVDAEDLGAARAPNREDADYIRTLANERALPRRLELIYDNPDAEFEEYSAWYGLPEGDTSSRATKQLRTQLSMTDDQAQTQAFVLFADARRERDQVEIRLPMNYARVNAGDTLSVPVGGDTLTIRVAERTAGLTGLFKGFVEQAETYDASLSGGLEPHEPSTLPLTADIARAVVIDAALPYDAIGTQDGYALTATPSPAGRDLDSADLFVSTDDGVNYEYVSGFDSTGDPEWGEATEALGDAANTYAIDRATVLKVRMYEGVPTSSTVETIMADATVNLAYVESGDAWEIVQFATVSDQGGGVYHLSDLMRGRRGTEHLTGGHAIGDRVFMVSTVLRSKKEAADGAALTFLAVPDGGDEDDQPEVEITLSLRGLEPYSVIDVAGSRDGSNDLTVTATGRVRTGGADVFGQAVPDDAEVSGWEMNVLDGSGAVLRTIEADSGSDKHDISFTYTAADQTSDGLTPGDPVDVKVYQIGATAGRGVERAATV